jgi:hypothetical protein
MSGHHPFQYLVENLPEERKLTILLSGGYANENSSKKYYLHHGFVFSGIK